MSEITIEELRKRQAIHRHRHDELVKRATEERDEALRIEGAIRYLRSLEDAETAPPEPE